MQIILSQHAEARLNQRGISRDMIDFVLRYGEVNQDKTYIDHKGADQIIKELEESLKIARQRFGKPARINRAKKTTRKDAFSDYDIVSR